MTVGSSTAEMPQWRIALAGRTEVGPKRYENQDALVLAGVSTGVTGTTVSWEGMIPEGGLVAAVIDGMGGHAGGSDAASLVAGEPAPVPNLADTSGWNSWTTAFPARVSHGGSVWETPDGGATAATFVILPHGIAVTNVGDCRAYQIIDGHLGQLSVDDRLSSDRQSHTVTQALGATAQVDAHFWLQHHDAEVKRYVLCSDGVWGEIDPRHFRDIVSSSAPPLEIVNRVAGALYEANAGDNGTVLVVDVSKAPSADAESSVSSVAVHTATSSPQPMPPLGNQGEPRV